MNRLFACGALAMAALLSPAIARGQCGATPPQAFEVEAGATNRAERTDASYAARYYQHVAQDVVASAQVQTSPTHAFLPQTTFGGALDFRAEHGYGVQTGYELRNYTGQRAQVLTTGIDRYAGNSRVALVLSFAGLTNVSGVAMSETLQTAKYFACDALGASLSFGRDVENTGAANRVAVYSVRSLDLSDVHWISPRTGVSAGVDWYALRGAYTRLEVRLALRQRI